MCPQPSEPDGEDHQKMNLETLYLADSKGVTNIGLTGGEPTLQIEHLCHLLEICKTKFRDTSISLLTNGKAFYNCDVVNDIALVEHPKLEYCISLHSDVDVIHDPAISKAEKMKESMSDLNADYQLLLNHI